MSRMMSHTHSAVAVAAAAVLVASLLVVFLWPLPAQAQSSITGGATITVNTDQDESTPNDQKCSLREAIQNANDNAQSSPDCKAGSGEDTITFGNGLSSGTITLDPSLGPLTVTDPAGLTIYGGNESITVSGGDKVQVFSESKDAKLALRNLTVANGSAGSGGGIQNKGGTLEVTNSTFSDNNAVGMSSSGQIDCTNACFGGGIDNDGGTLTVTRSTFSGNKSDAIGGGINNGGTLSVTNSTFSGNSAGFVGSGINNGGMLTVNYSTFSGNVGSGAINNANAEGVTLTLSNTILAKSRDGNIREVCAGGSCQGTITDGGYNISDDDSTSKFFTDQTSKSNTDPGFAGDLANNGGPTQTIALQKGSPAIDYIPKGTNGCGTTIKTDQRGVTRPQGSGCDVGAFELTVATPPPPPPGHHHKHQHGHHKHGHHKKHHGSNGGGGGGGVTQ